MLKLLADKIALSLSTYTEREQDWEALAYGLNILLVFTLSTLGIFVFAFMLAIPERVFFYMVALIMFRSFGGGVHHKYLWRCFITTSIIVLIPCYYSIYFWQWPVFIVTLLILLLVIIKWVPAGINREGKTSEQINSAKRKTLIGLLLWLAIIAWLYYIAKPDLAGALIAGGLGSAFLISPFGFITIEGIDRWLDSGKGGEKT